MIYHRVINLILWGDKLKEKIERFSKGDFEYEQPSICLSTEDIRLTIEAGKEHQGSFTISNPLGTMMKGKVFSSNRLLSLDNSAFQGVENLVQYTIDAKFLNESDSIIGDICIISDCGEQIIPFVVEIEAPFFDTSIGKINDLYQFANLARLDWVEAKKIFRSSEFERVFLNQDTKYNHLYHNLIKSISTSQALEEFLIAIRKKSMIKLHLDQVSLEYQISEDNISDKITLHKDHWGYMKIAISTNSPFIQLEQKYVWTDSFASNSHSISFTIDKSKLGTGNYYGRIFIATVHQTLVVDVLCRCKKKVGKQEAGNQKRFLSNLVHNYLSFRTEQINLPQYFNQVDNLLEGRSFGEKGSIIDLLKIHTAIISGNEKQAEFLLDKLSRTEVVTGEKPVELYCGYLYLEALFNKDEKAIEQAAAVIRNYYEKDKKNWYLLWYLLYTDKRYEKNKSLKLSHIKEQFEAGCHSPVLYYEAICIYQEEPVLLRELTNFEIQVIHFGIRYNFLTMELVRQYTYLANKKKKFQSLVFHSLVKLYEEYQMMDILSTICSTLIKGLKREEKYFYWYQLGVMNQLRITELFEYYMYSIPEYTEEQVALPVLHYFVYNSNLSDRKKALLYAYIVKNKEKLPDLYRTYYKRMELFAMKQLEAYHINKNLAVLYDEFIQIEYKPIIAATHLPEVMFQYELTCANPNMIGVIVVHKERKEEEQQILENNKAKIHIFSSNAELFFLDAEGNRYAATITYTLDSFLSAEKYSSMCEELVDHPRSLLYLYEKYQSYHIFNIKAILVRQKVLQLEGLHKDFIIKGLQALIDYAYDNYDIEMLEQYLLQINLDLLKPSDRIKLMEYIVMRDLFDKAIPSFDKYGYEGISINRLVKFSSKLVQRLEVAELNHTLLSLCYYVFTKGKYDEAILKYLSKHYCGTTKDMFALWQAAKNFEIETHELEERLLIQMLFSESYVQDSLQVFTEYYKNVTNRMIVRAFLSYYAYKYLLFDRVIQAELFGVMRRELNYEENDICLLALLKYYTTVRELSEPERAFIEYNLRKFEAKRMILPFFMEFGNEITLPELMSDKFYVEYKTHPRKKVYIHYRLLNRDSDNEFITERMQDSFMGIHVKEFVLFYQENLQYYITEEEGEDVIITESLNIHFDKDIADNEDTSYNQINLMLMAKELKDEKTLLDLMKQYTRNQYMISKCFRPI